ncbi:unnamed protein product [Protopolystoma xenopodis]|uniref:Uncharacterized protein n=1 Tax=Protopolystoma xenopodis TaxID=117903 RepID=A0A3S5A8H3_9PLAT|nr:unnamed protein product [Protopolystoma xenopodis]
MQRLPRLPARPDLPTGLGPRALDASGNTSTSAGGRIGGGEKPVPQPVNATRLFVLTQLLAGRHWSIASSLCANV